MSQYRFLFVDDEPDVTFAIKTGLEEHSKEQFIVDIYNDPQEALSNYKPGIHDLLLIDVKRIIF
jgi:two-component system, OmpR family, response regulator ChvI